MDEDNIILLICEGRQTKGTYECNMNETRVVTRVLLDYPIRMPFRREKVNVPKNGVDRNYSLIIKSFH